MDVGSIRKHPHRDGETGRLPCSGTLVPSTAAFPAQRVRARHGCMESSTGKPPSGLCSPSFWLFLRTRHMPVLSKAVGVTLYEVTFTQHRINHYKVHALVAFSAFAMLCKQNHTTSTKNVIHYCSLLERARNNMQKTITTKVVAQIVTAKQAP